MTKIKIFFAFYVIVIFFLFLYSFTQIDLSLTLSQFSLWQVIEKFFQHIGYFNRPLSTVFYLTIVVLLFIFYGIMLLLAHKKRITKREVWFLIGLISIVLAFSYNAFSYDLFNYIFDAKIITYYNQNPYEHKALDFPQDPMLSFMRWTHRTYPYGPVWLAITVPLSYLGSHFFLPTFFLFKILIVSSFIGTVFFIGKIIKKIAPSHELFSLVFFGLNPLVMVESLVSSHNDIVMIFLTLSSFYYLLKKKYILALFIFLLSVGIKFASIFLLPVFAIIFILQKKKKEISWDVIILGMIILMLLAVIAASIRTNFQPWYLLYLLPFAAFISRKTIIVPCIIISLFALLQYVPFLYQGDWNSPVPNIISYLTVGSIVLSIISIFFWRISFIIRNKIIKK